MFKEGGVSHVRASSGLRGDFTRKAAKFTLLLAGTSMRMQPYAPNGSFS